MILISSEPLPEKVMELARCFSDVVELPKDGVKREIEDWLVKELVARSLG